MRPQRPRRRRQRACLCRRPRPRRRPLRPLAALLRRPARPPAASPCPTLPQPRPLLRCRGARRPTARLPRRQPLRPLAPPTRPRPWRRKAGRLPLTRLRPRPRPCRRRRRRLPGVLSRLWQELQAVARSGLPPALPRALRPRPQRRTPFPQRCCWARQRWQRPRPRPRPPPRAWSQTPGWPQRCGRRRRGPRLAAPGVRRKRVTPCWGRRHRLQLPKALSRRRRRRPGAARTRLRSRGRPRRRPCSRRRRQPQRSLEARPSRSRTRTRPVRSQARPPARSPAVPVWACSACLVGWRLRKARLTMWTGTPWEDSVLRRHAGASPNLRPAAGLHALTRLCSHPLQLAGPALGPTSAQSRWGLHASAPARLSAAARGRTACGALGPW